MAPRSPVPLPSYYGTGLQGDVSHRSGSANGSGHLTSRAGSQPIPRVIARTLLIIGLAALGTGTLGLIPASAQEGKRAIPQESPLAAKVRKLNDNLLALQMEMQGNSEGHAAIRDQAATIIAQRAAALKELIRQDPRTALTFAFSPELLNHLASQMPQSARLLESQGTWRGPVEVWVADYVKPVHSKTTVLMRIGPQKIELHFGGPLPALESGTEMEVTGVTVGSDMAVSHFAVIPERGTAGTSAAPTSTKDAKNPIEGMPLPASLLFVFMSVFVGWALRLRVRKMHECATLGLKIFAVSATALAMIVCVPLSGYSQNSACTTKGPQNVAVLLATFPNVTLPSTVTTSSLNDIFFGTNTGWSLDGFLREASYGQTSATGSVFGPYTLTGTYTSCADVGGAVLDDAIAAAVNDGVALQSYDRIFLVFPDIFGCGWAGYTSSSCSFTTPSGTFNASVVYLAASYVEGRSEGVELAAHELGHDFGLLHSGTISNGAQPLGPLTSPGTEVDMGDYWSVMGAMDPGLYPAPQKAEVLGWMTSGTNYLTVQNNGTYTLQPLEVSPPGLQALRVQRGTGNNAWLWVEYRQPIGTYDSSLLPQPFSGALIHYEDQNIALGHTYLPDFTPSDTTGNSPALAAGQSWTDPYSNVSISVLSATSSGLTVSISYGAMPCTTTAPTINLSPADPSIYAGQSASYTVSVTDNDSSGCSSDIFNVSSTDPSGWSSSLSASSITLSPGQSGSVSLTEGAPSGTAPGTYPVAVTAANSSDSGSGTANATVMAPSLAVSVAVSGTTFTPPATVSMDASVLYNGVPSSGASVTFTLTSPTGSTTTGSAATNSNGIATWSYKLGPKSPAGTYSVVAQAALSSNSGGGGKKGKLAGSVSTATSNVATFSVR